LILVHSVVPERHSSPVAVLMAYMLPPTTMGWNVPVECPVNGVGTVVADTNFPADGMAGGSVGGAWADIALAIRSRQAAAMMTNFFMVASQSKGS